MKHLPGWAYTGWGSTDPFAGFGNTAGSFYLRNFIMRMVTVWLSCAGCLPARVPLRRRGVRTRIVRSPQPERDIGGLHDQFAAAGEVAARCTVDLSDGKGISTLLNH